MILDLAFNPLGARRESMTSSRTSASTLAAIILAGLVGCADEHDHDHHHHDSGILPDGGGTTNDGSVGTDGGVGGEDATLDSGTDGGTETDSGTDGAVEPELGIDGYLLVAELADGSEAIHAYSLPDLTHTGSLPGILLGNHVGAIALEDGRVITTNDRGGEVIAIRIRDDGTPEIAERATVDLGGRAMWGCGDADLEYLAISSGRAGNGPQNAIIVNLGDFSVTEFDVPMNVIDGNTEELHPFLAGEPLHLFAGVGGEIHAWPLADVLAGTAADPVLSMTVETGSHGPVVSHTHGRLYFAARAGTGFDGVDFGADPIVRAQMIPWDVDELATGRNGRPRLSWDGRYIYGAVQRSTPTGAENWALRAVDFHAADLTNQTASRRALTTGIVPKFQLSEKYAFFANITADGDFAILVDVEAGSTTFQNVVARIPLEALENGPIVGQATTGREARGSAITPDGKWGFVSHGGEGKISVIDTEERSVAGTIETPTSLAGGGYMIAIQPGRAPVDTCTR